MQKNLIYVEYTILFIIDPFICAGFTVELKFKFCISVKGTWGRVGGSVEVHENGVQMMLEESWTIEGQLGYSGALR